MKLTSVKQLAFDGVTGGYDAVIAASGYESRARHVAESIARRVIVNTNVVLGFAEHREAHARPENDKTFERLGFAPTICQGSLDSEVSDVFVKVIREFAGKKTPRILVDITSMTRTWYGAMIRQLSNIDLPAGVIIDFSYAAAEFINPPSDYPPNRVAGPVPGFSGNTLPDKPAALVLGLGYDKDRALGLKGHLDPQLTVLLYANPANDPRYVAAVLSVNAELIKEVGEDCLVTYSFFDCEGAFHLLESVCNGLSHDWRVVVCSLGPKLFGLCCFLVASRLRDVSIWRVSAATHELPFDHRACGVPTLLRTEWFGRNISD